MPPRPVRSKPELVTFPPCLTCGATVEYTLTYEARALVDQAVAAQYRDKAPAAADPNRRVIFVGDETHPFALDRLGLVDVGGAPDKDQVMTMPCECVQHGVLAHGYLVAALNMSNPDLIVEVRVTIPAELAGGDTPTTLTARTRMEPADVRQQQALGLNPVELALVAGAEQVRRALPEGVR